MSAATKREIREYMRATRESFRAAEAALTALRFDDACDFATQAAGCAGEVESLVYAYVSERTDSRFVSGEAGRA